MEKTNLNYYLIERYNLKENKISFHYYECSLKNIEFSYLDENKKWAVIKKIIKNAHIKRNITNFEINIYSKKIKLYLMIIVEKKKEIK